MTPAWLANSPANNLARMAEREGSLIRAAIWDIGFFFCDTLIKQRLHLNPKKALGQLHKLPDEYQGPALTYLKGMCYYKLRQYDQAVEFFEQTIRDLDKMPDLEKTNLRASCLHHLGQALLLMAETLLADSHYEEALSHYLEVHKLNVEDKEIQSKALKGLAYTYLLMDDEDNYRVYSKLYFKSFGV
ncbi:hypothetical protein [Laceyella putida]|uniref:Tetratricopeptide repeat protein n=1 Tax=Laceyella putida TaxID=110101 RepID=A0ABW2RM71_9BACL